MYLQQRWLPPEAGPPPRWLFLSAQFISERRRCLIVGRSSSGCRPAVVESVEGEFFLLPGGVAALSAGACYSC